MGASATGSASWNAVANSNGASPGPHEASAFNPHSCSVPRSPRNPEHICGTHRHATPHRHHLRQPQPTPFHRCRHPCSPVLPHRNGARQACVHVDAGTTFWRQPVHHHNRPYATLTCDLVSAAHKHTGSPRSLCGQHATTINSRRRAAHSLQQCSAPARATAPPRNEVVLHRSTKPTPHERHWPSRPCRCAGYLYGCCARQHIGALYVGSRPAKPRPHSGMRWELFQGGGPSPGSKSLHQPWGLKQSRRRKC